MNLIWPHYSPKPEYKALADSEVQRYRNKLGYEPYLQQYEPFGDYLNYGKFKYYRDVGIVKLDEEGIPQIRYGDRHYYNPVPMAQHALALYGRYTRDPKWLDGFLRAADKLLAMQDSTGAFRYPFPYAYYRKNYEAGWASGMAQGQALSVLARCYKIAPGPRYLHTGNAAFRFLTLPVSKGGTTVTLEYLHPSLKAFIFFEEYPALPPAYTLNGFLFTLLGVYDWHHAVSAADPKHSNDAKNSFQQGILTLKQILRYYDIGGYSTYDLAHIVYGMSPKRAGLYHGVHLYLLHALCSVAHDKELQQYYDLWKSYIN